VDFPEINFRTYVRQGDRRGVVAIRELVPSPLAAAIGRLRFNEPFRATPIESRTASMGDELLVEHRWRWKERHYFLRMTADQSSATATEGPARDLFGRRWAYGRSRRGEPIVLRVEHPDWALRRVRTLDFEVDYGALYGPEWAFSTTNRSLPRRRIGDLDLPARTVVLTHGNSPSGTVRPLPRAGALDEDGDLLEVRGGQQHPGRTDPSVHLRRRPRADDGTRDCGPRQHPCDRDLPDRASGAWRWVRARRGARDWERTAVA
jgi:hypothetical protein